MTAWTMEANFVPGMVRSLLSEMQPTATAFTGSAASWCGGAISRPAVMVSPASQLSGPRGPGAGVGEVGFGERLPPVPVSDARGAHLPRGEDVMPQGLVAGSPRRSPKSSQR